MASTSKAKADKVPCQWISGHDAFRRFATHAGGTESARHIKPLHWYIACRLVLEGGFHPDDITPRPPFEVMRRARTRQQAVLSYNPAKAGTGEQIVLGGLKTKNVDVVVTKPGIGPVMAVSCKGVTKAFRNLTNRMEETIGECTNLHITYPAMVLGYFALMRANRSLEDVLEAPSLEPDEDAAAPDGEPALTPREETETVGPVAARITANDIAILGSGAVTHGIVRFHAALKEMTLRRGVRNEISRYEAITIAMIEPKGDQAGSVYPDYPPADSPLRLETFFETLYQRYEERFVYGAPLLADRGVTTRYEWAPESPVFTRASGASSEWPELDFAPRLASG